MKKVRTKTNDQVLGLNQAPCPSDVIAPDDESIEADPPNRAVLAAIAALRNEVAQVKDDICATIDTHIQTVYRPYTPRSEINWLQPRKKYRRRLQLLRRLQPHMKTLSKSWKIQPHIVRMM